MTALSDLLDPERVAALKAVVGMNTDETAIDTDCIDADAAWAHTDPELKKMGDGHESLDTSPKQNWVEKAGGLPGPISRIAKDIHEKRGLPLGMAIAIAIGACKRWCAGGGKVTSVTRAEACGAIADWEKLKAKDAGVLLELKRMVRTEAGAHRFHVPIGTEIGSGRGADLRDAQDAAASAGHAPAVRAAAARADTTPTERAALLHLADTLEQGSTDLEGEPPAPGEPPNSRDQMKNAGNALKALRDSIKGGGTLEEHQQLAINAHKALTEIGTWAQGSKASKVADLLKKLVLSGLVIMSKVPPPAKKSFDVKDVSTSSGPPQTTSGFGSVNRLSPVARAQAARTGRAMPDGSFPIHTKPDLAKAIQAHGRAKNPTAAKRHIKKRARALGATDMLPESWQSKADSEGIVMGTEDEVIEVKGGDAPASMEHKAEPMTAVIDTNDDTGTVTALVSVTGVEDRVKDIIEPGAYTKTLAQREPIGVWAHNDSTWVARAEEIKELAPGDPFFTDVTTNDGQAWPSDAGALRVKARFNLETPHGAAAYSDVKFFQGKSSWSIGYRVTDSTRDRSTGVRRIKALELYEFSPVMVGAAAQARTLSVKSLAQPVDANAEPDTADLPDEVDVPALLAARKAFFGTEYKGTLPPWLKPGGGKPTDGKPKPDPAKPHEFVPNDKKPPMCDVCGKADGGAIHDMPATKAGLPPWLTPGGGKTGDAKPKNADGKAVPASEVPHKFVPNGKSPLCKTCMKAEGWWAHKPGAKGPHHPDNAGKAWTSTDEVKSLPRCAACGTPGFSFDGQGCAACGYGEKAGKVLSAATSEKIMSVFVAMSDAMDTLGDMLVSAGVIPSDGDTEPEDDGPDGETEAPAAADTTVKADATLETKADSLISEVDLLRARTLALTASM